MDLIKRLLDLNKEWSISSPVPLEAAGEIETLREALEVRRKDSELLREQLSNAMAQVARVELERDKWKSEAIDHCEKVVKQANATLSDRHYMRVMDEQLASVTKERDEWKAEVQHLHDVALGEEGKKQLAKCERERDEVANYWMDMYDAVAKERDQILKEADAVECENADLRTILTNEKLNSWNMEQQLAACEQELSEFRKNAKAGFDRQLRDQAKLATVTAERDELVAALKGIASCICDNVYTRAARAALAKVGADNGEK